MNDDSGVIELKAAMDRNAFGGKATSLGTALSAGVSVPRGIALSVATVQAVVEQHQDTRARVTAIAERLGKPVAVRSSAVDEDADSTSFAGVHHSVLAPADLMDAIVAVHASAYCAEALAYRKRRGITAPPRMAVLLQELIPADIAGVAFTADPVTGNDNVVVEVVSGLGEPLVAGDITPEHWELDRDGRVRHCQLGDQDRALRVRAGNTELEPVPMRSSYLLTESRRSILLALLQTLDSIYEGAHDVEFVFSGERLWLLQRRRITVIPGISTR